MRCPSDEELKESILTETFPLYHRDDQGILHPRSSGILKLHPDSLHRRIHFGDESPYFLQYVEQSAIEGNRIHDAIRGHVDELMRRNIIPHKDFELKEPLDDTDMSLTHEEILKVRRCISWMLEQEITVLHPPEETIVARSLQYGGSPDLVCSMKKKTWVIDFKTGKHIQNCHWLQVESYARLLKVQFDINVDMIGVLILGSDKVARLVKRPVSNDAHREFQALQRQWFEFFPIAFQPPSSVQGSPEITRRQIPA